MTAINSYSFTSPTKPMNANFVSGESDQAREMMVRQKEIMQAKLARDDNAQRAYQNSAEVNTAFRLNGELVGTISSLGFTSKGINDDGAYQRAQISADQRGLTGEDRIAFIADAVTQALQDRYGSDLAVETFGEGSRPTSGTMHEEMFGASSNPSQPNPDELAYMKFFAQLYSQTFGEDPFASVIEPVGD